MQLPVLTYFSSRGLAELIRVALAEAAVPYEQRLLGTVGANENELFVALRSSGVLPFGAVPLWEEPDGFRLAQSDAILRHIARTHGLYGADARAAARCDMVHEGTKDVGTQLRGLRTARPDERAGLREELTNAVIPRRLGQFEKLLATNHGGGAWFVGATLTYADLAVWHLLETLRDNRLTTLDGSPLLRAFAERVAARPNLARYLADPQRFPAQLLPV